MPPVLILFFTLVGLGAGSALTEVPVWKGTDAPSSPRNDAPAPGSIVRTAPWFDGYAKDGECGVTLIVATPGLRRLVVDGVEQNVDHGWSLGYRVLPGKTTWEVWIIHPVTRNYEYDKVWFNCKLPVRSRSIRPAKVL